MAKKNKRGKAKRAGRGKSPSVAPAAGSPDTSAFTDSGCSLRSGRVVQSLPELPTGVEQQTQPGELSNYLPDPGSEFSDNIEEDHAVPRPTTAEDQLARESGDPDTIVLKPENPPPGFFAPQESSESSVRSASPTMSVRNRPRNGAVKDEAEAHEEINMWNQIKKDLEKLSFHQKRQMELGEKIKKKEAENKELENAKKLGQKDINELESLYRELLKLSAEENRMLNEEPTDLIRNVEILKALSEATREAPPQPSSQRGSTLPKIRKHKPSSRGPNDLDGAADSPGPNSGNMVPTVQIPSVRVKGSERRSGSVASTRDGRESVSAKSEDGYDGTKGSSAERAGKFVVGAEVAYRQSKPREDGSQWIQCVIISVADIGNKKRYEVQDAEPEENNEPAMVFKTTASSLMAIPSADAELPMFPVGRYVLARYPETTTFYRAEVMGHTEQGYRLKFEDDQDNKMDVPRRYVLDVKGSGV